MQSTLIAARIDDILAIDERPDEDVLDDVYRKYRDSHPLMPVTHFVDHSTMGPEALVALGLGHKVMEWSARHGVRAYEPPRTGVPIPSGWREAAGRKECHGDWLHHFDSELNAGPFGDVLAVWVERFAHDAGALLFHGLIRTAHAARALEHKDSLARREELARGLALWAIGLSTAAPAEPPRETPDADWTSEIMRCARAGAATFVRKSTIPNLHLITGPMAYLMIAHHLHPGIHRIAAGAFRRTHAKALETVEADETAALSEPLPSLDPDRLEALSAKTDAHPAKLTEAALRAYRMTGDELFLKAAARVQAYSLWRAMVG
jgi:hypothetical protein